MGAGDPRASEAQDALPKVPIGRDPGGVPVGFIGPGVNYTLPQIAQRLARDGEGEIIGFDFETGRMQPFDRWPGPGGMIVRQGTPLANLLLREAGAATLIAIRHHPGHPESLAAAVSMLQRSRARIALMQASGPNPKDFITFRQVAELAKDMLFVVRAGDGDATADIDTQPSYPAAFGLANVLVVTGTDTKGRLLPGSSWGRATVDVALPAADLTVTDFAGTDIIVTGERYAAARATALAARLKAVHPDLGGARLKAKILEFARPDPAEPISRTKAGWIADPRRIAWLE